MSQHPTATPLTEQELANIRAHPLGTLAKLNQSMLATIADLQGQVERLQIEYDDARSERDQLRQLRADDVAAYERLRTQPPSAAGKVDQVADWLLHRFCPIQVTSEVFAEAIYDEYRGHATELLTAIAHPAATQGQAYGADTNRRSSDSPERDFSLLRTASAQTPGGA